MQNRNSTRLVDRVIQMTQYLAVQGVNGQSVQVFCHRFAGHCHDIAVHNSCIHKSLHENGQATVTVDIVHDEPAKRLKIPDVGHLCTNAVEVIE